MMQEELAPGLKDDLPSESGAHDLSNLRTFLVSLHLFLVITDYPLS
jgi:hypothetical protein